MRDYEAIAAAVRPLPDRSLTMQAVVDLLWEALSSSGISWVGFYVKDLGGDQLLLGPRRNKPACSPIGLHGVCGQSYLRKRPIVVHDVADLGPDYIACDPRDRSEVVVPLLEDDGTCWGVLDVDSFEVGAFDEHDVEGLGRVLTAAGLKAPGGETPDRR